MSTYDYQGHGHRSGCYGYDCEEMGCDLDAEAQAEQTRAAEQARKDREEMLARQMICGPRPGEMDIRPQEVHETTYPDGSPPTIRHDRYEDPSCQAEADDEATMAGRRELDAMRGEP